MIEDDDGGYKPPPPPRLSIETATDTLGVFWKPLPAFINELAAWLKGKRVLEVFAGNGFLAAHLQARGIQVQPTTQFSGHDAHVHGLYCNVQEMEANVAVQRLGNDADVLLMCWPTADTRATLAALRWELMYARPIVFIGECTDFEMHGYGGGCATDEFFACMRVEHEFKTYRGNMLERAIVVRMDVDKLEALQAREHRDPLDHRIRNMLPPKE